MIESGQVLEHMERVAASPARARPGSIDSNGFNSNESHSRDEDSRVARALSLLCSFDSTARIEAVVRNVDTTLVRMTPGTESKTSTQMAALTAMRVSFPFSSVIATENVVSGETQIQLLLSSNQDAVKHAKEYYASTRAFKTLDRISNALLFGSLFTFAILLQASLTVDNNNSTSTNH